MDIVLTVLDEYLLTPYSVYPASWEEDFWLRQVITLFVVVCSGGAILYLLLAGFSYYFIFDHRLMQHPKFLKVCTIFANFSHTFAKKTFLDERIDNHINAGGEWKYKGCICPLPPPPPSPNPGSCPLF